MKGILILGAGIMQIPAIKLALKEGWRVYVVDGVADAPGAPLAHRFYNTDLRDLEGILKTATTLHRQEGLDGVFTVGTDFSFAVASVAELLGLPGISPEAATAASDKGVMRRTLQAGGVPIPSYLEIGAEQKLVEVLNELTPPLVIKPVDNMGSRGVRLVRTIEDLEQGVSQALKHSHSGRLVVEEYIEGKEFSLDALIDNGTITVCGTADRHIHFPPYFIEMGHTIPTSCSEEICREVERVFRDGITALNITHGAAKGDILYSPDRGAVVGEIAARLSGGFMSGWSFPSSSGVEVILGGLRLAMGQSPGELSPKWKRYSAERAMISIPGVIEEIIGYDRACEIKGVDYGYLRVSQGERINFPVNNVGKCGNFLSSSIDREVAIEVATTAAATPFFRMRVADEETTRFISRESHHWVPDAFTLTSPENIAYCNTPLALDSPPLDYIPVLPDIEGEECRDWQGRQLLPSLQAVATYTRLPLKRGIRTPAEGRFWRAFLRGGIQGGVWQIESEIALSSSRDRKGSELL